VSFIVGAVGAVIFLFVVALEFGLDETYPTLGRFVLRGISGDRWPPEHAGWGWALLGSLIGLVSLIGALLAFALLWEALL
jgi:hypothetical protein